MSDENREIIELQKNLEMLRKLFGWTAEQLGNRLGVTKQTISNLEHGNPKMSKIQYIAIRAIMEAEANQREGEERENLLKILRLVFDEDEQATEEQRERALETANVVASATSKGVGKNASMGVMTAALGAIGIGALMSPLAGAGAIAAGTLGGWLTSMLTKTKLSEHEDKKKKDKESRDV